MDISRPQAALDAGTTPGARRISWAGWSALAAAGVLPLSGCSEPPPPFAVFEVEAGEQDTLPDWVSLEGGAGEVRFLAANDLTRYYISRNSTSYCLVVVGDGPEEYWSGGCSDGLGYGMVITSSNPDSGSAALVVDGYAGRNDIAAEGWQQLHENVLVRGGDLTQELKAHRSGG